MQLHFQNLKHRLQSLAGTTTTATTKLWITLTSKVVVPKLNPALSSYCSSDLLWPILLNVKQQCALWAAHRRYKLCTVVEVASGKHHAYMTLINARDSAQSMPVQPQQRRNGWHLSANTITYLWRGLSYYVCIIKFGLSNSCHGRD